MGPEVHPGKHKDEVGLQHDKHHHGDDAGGLDGAETLCRELDDCDELQGEVDDAAQAEDDGPDPHWQGPVTLKREAGKKRIA